MSAQSNLEPSNKLCSRAAGAIGSMGTKYVVCLIWGSGYLAILHTYVEAPMPPKLKEKLIVSVQSNLEPSDELCSRAIGKYGDLGTVAL